MNDMEFEEGKARRFAAWPWWKRWSAKIGLLDSQVLLMSDAERQNFKTEHVRRFSDWPIWKKSLAMAGLALAAISVPLHSYLFGQLTIGWKSLGLTRTIVASEEPELFIATLLLLECAIVLLFYFLTKVFFFNRDEKRSSS